MPKLVSTALPTNLKDWLAHRSALPPKNKGRGMKKVSDKRKGENRIYTVRRRAYLAEHPYCEAWFSIPFKMRLAICFGDHREAMNCPRSQEIHHMKKPKQTYFLDENTWLAVSRLAHQFIEDNKSTARQLGLLK